MKHITEEFLAQLTFCHVFVLLSWVTLAVLGQPVESQAGWYTCPPRLVDLGTMPVRRRREPSLLLGDRLRALWDHMCHSWSRPALRSVLLGVLWELSGRRGPVVLLAWPWVLWLWQVVAAGWPGLHRQPVWAGGSWVLWHGQRVLMVSYLALALYPAWSAARGGRSGMSASGAMLGLGCLVCGREEPWVDVTREENGGYQATLCGHFVVRVASDDALHARLLLLFLRLLEVPGEVRSSRRTRDGRTPFVRQQQAAAWFAVPQPDISRVEGYWWRGAWPELLSQSTDELLTPEVVRRVVTVCATFPHWSHERLYDYLRQQGLRVSQRQLRQAMEQSGWSTLRQELARRYHWTPETFHLREEWLMAELLRQIQLLQGCLETGQQPPSEKRLALQDVQVFLQEAGVQVPPPPKAVPWLLRVQQLVLGDELPREEESIRCPLCGSTHIVRKSRQGRQKRFCDAQGQLQEMTVYRYYCRNPACAQGSFTHFPAGLLPYSRHRLEVHLLAWQAYAWSYSTYRRVGQALQLSEMTIYRWVSAWGHQLVPVAALFGVVRSSGVVGVDEKYVLVPKNDKPDTKMKRWMYVYLAVDVYTYDLLHIALYPDNTRHSAQAFLLALHGKGYHPQVVVTDLRRDYAAVIAQVFPQAQHHECLFHAEQEISQYLQKTWGYDYAQRQPAAEQLRADVVRIFHARTKRTAYKRYQALLAQQMNYVQRAPPLLWVFAFLEQHWPTLVNSLESELIPATNNAVEMVIRRFDQHYQNFCGFESLQSAQLYLGVFEKVYRFTPFSDDAQPRIRGKSPLQLAGYDMTQVPMTWLCRGYSLQWPLTLETDHVPNS
jgi:transposase-like protein